MNLNMLKYNVGYLHCVQMALSERWISKNDKIFSVPCVDKNMKSLNFKGEFSYLENALMDD